MNDIKVISVYQKTAIHAPDLQFEISPSAVDKALAKNDEPLVKKESESKNLTKYQKRLIDRLRQLKSIIFGDGASRGYSNMIAEQIRHLRELRKENPDEHDDLIKSNEHYRKLLKMFPDWTDRFYLQPQYEAKDAGLLATMAASYSVRSRL